MIFIYFLNATQKLPHQISDNTPDSTIFSSTRNKWKRIRTISNPTFTPSKIKDVTYIDNVQFKFNCVIR